MTHDDIQVLNTLDHVLQSRVKERPKDSYITMLLGKGEDAVLQKIGEEATELILAAKGDGGKIDNQAVVAETADLWFHTMIMLAHLDLSVNDVLTELKNRAGQSGLKE